MGETGITCCTAICARKNLISHWQIRVCAQEITRLMGSVIILIIWVDDIIISATTLDFLTSVKETPLENSK